MCHAFLSDPTFYRRLGQLDALIAEQVGTAGCPCGGVLHRADYLRKPVAPIALRDEKDCWRYSFCCARDGCRRRRTPPSLRFLGRKVYLSVVVVLITALEHGLTPRRRRALADRLDISPKTFYRWQRWWREAFAASPAWCFLSRRLLPPIGTCDLPGALLGRLTGNDLEARLLAFLLYLSPLTTGSCAGFAMEGLLPQKMG